MLVCVDVSGCGVDVCCRHVSEFLKNFYLLE